MIQLNSDEARALGVLIEKAQTTPQQYPLSVNGLITGCNQKNNRAPILALSEDDVVAALDGLREHGLAREVDLSGSRVIKFRHVTRDALGVDTKQLVVLAELLLRGPQTVGELRGRASRMFPLESVEVVHAILESMMALEEPLVREIAPAPGSRAPRFEQMLAPGIHPVDLPAVAAAAAPGAATPASASLEAGLAARLAALEAKVEQLTAAVERLGGGVP